MSSNENSGCGCLVLLGVLTVIGLFNKCTDKHGSAPTVSQPSTGVVYPAAAPRGYTQDERRIPTVSEPFGQLQSGGFTNADSALRMTNNLGNPAYVKVIDGYGGTCATIYLRAGESYELRVASGSYALRYVSGPGSEWRGTTHYFGSSSSFFEANADYIGTNRRLSVTFYRSRASAGSSGSLHKISESEF